MTKSPQGLEMLTLIISAWTMSLMAQVPEETLNRALAHLQAPDTAADAAFMHHCRRMGSETCEEERRNSANN